MITELVGSIAQAVDATWEYRTPVLDKAANHVVRSLDGAQVLMVNDGWREAMVGTISLVDCDGEHQHTTCFGAAPEHGKATFLKRFERELERVKSQYPNFALIKRATWKAEVASSSTHACPCCAVQIQ